MTHSYYAKDGKVYVKQTGQPDREAGTALTANGRDLERHDAALQLARRQRGDANARLNAAQQGSVPRDISD